MSRVPEREQERNVTRAQMDALRAMDQPRGARLSQHSTTKVSVNAQVAHRLKRRGWVEVRREGSSIWPNWFVLTDAGREVLSDGS